MKKKKADAEKREITEKNAECGSDLWRKREKMGTPEEDKIRGGTLQMKNSN